MAITMAPIDLPKGVWTQIMGTSCLISNESTSTEIEICEYMTGTAPAATFRGHTMQPNGDWAHVVPAAGNSCWGRAVDRDGRVVVTPD